MGGGRTAQGSVRPYITSYKINNVREQEAAQLLHSPPNYVHAPPNHVEPVYYGILNFP